LLGFTLAVVRLGVVPRSHDAVVDTSLHRLAACAAAQRGCISRAQAADAGFGSRRLETLVHRGVLAQIGPGAFRIAGAPLTVWSNLHGLVLDVGGQVWVSGPTAAALHGFDGFVLRPPFHLTVLRGRDPKRSGHQVHTTALLPNIDRAVVEGLPVTAAARTLVDLARNETAERLTAALDSGLRDGKFNESFVHRRIVALRGSGRSGIPRLIEVIDGCEVTRGGHSWLEREYLRLIAAAGLPRPESQVVLSRARNRTVRVDFRFPGTPVVAEVLGYRFHRTRDQMRRDAQRMNALILDGLMPVQHTYDQVVAEPDAVIDDLQRALTAVLEGPPGRADDHHRGPLTKSAKGGLGLGLEQRLGKHQTAHLDQGDGG
jgi:hypothetical protein